MASSKGKPRKIISSEPEEVESTLQTEIVQWSDIKHFSPRDFTCTCKEFCDHPVVISMNLVTKLDKIREQVGRHLNILSGTRCERHNRKVSGKLHSSHVPKQGVSHAVDVHCPDSSFRFAFLAAALPLFTRIGVGKDFIHVDDDPDLPPACMWVYGPDRSGELTTETTCSPAKES